MTQRLKPATRVLAQHPLLTVQQAAELLGFSGMTIRRRIAARQFPAVKIGSKAMVPRSFVEELLAAATAGQTVVLEEFAEQWAARMRESNHRTPRVREGAS